MLIFSLGKTKKEHRHKMNTLIHLSQKQQAAALEALHILCDIFWGPDIDKCKRFFYQNGFRPFDILADRWKHASPGILDNLKGFIRNFPDEAALFSFLEEAYIRIFINARTSVVPLYQSCYDDSSTQLTEPQAVLMGPSAVLMKERFADKGLSLADDLNDPPDHLAIELEYLYFLLQRGWSQQDDVLLSEAVTFASDCMLPWVTAFRNRLLSELNCPFYPLAAALLVAYLKGLSNP